MYRQVLIPDKKNHSIEMPEKFFGKRVEVIVNEISNADWNAYPTPPAGKTIDAKELFENFGANPAFPSIDEIRSKAWPEKW